MRVLTFLLALLFVVPTFSQNLHIDVAAKYGVTFADGSKRVADKYAAGKDTLSTGLYYAWQRWKNEGMDYATFRQTFIGCAIAKDVAWAGEAPNLLISGFQNTFSFGDWRGARGKWQMNRTVQLPRAGMEGASSFWYAGQGSDQGQEATEFVMNDTDWWPANQTERRVFESPNSSLNGENNFSYNESFRVERIKLSGPGKSDNIKRIGLFIRRAGECAWINQVRSDDFDIGIVAYGGVPFSAGTITTFGNNIAGFAGLGTALSTINIHTLSGDDNKYLLLLDDMGYGAPGGNVHVGLLKSEGGITAGRTYRNQVAGFFNGQYSITVEVVSFANKAPSIPEAMFVVNPTLGGGAKQRSLLNVGASKGFGYQYLLSNRVTGSKWTSSGDYSAVNFQHYASGDKLITQAPDVVLSTGTPSGTWTCTAYSECLNGQQTRTCTCSSTTCVDPKPAEVQSCTTTTVPPVVPVLTFTPFATGTELGILREGKFAVDGNASTFWISGKSMAKNQSVEVSFTSRSVKEITFSSGTYTNSYPRTYTLHYWNGSDWSQIGTYTGAVNCTQSWTEKTTTRLKITCTTANGNWWAINELTIK